MLNKSKKNFKLYFFEDQIETGLPIIRLTRSKNGETGTATFVFRNLNFLFSNLENFPLNNISLISDKERIEITDISILFLKGKPFLIKAILVLKSPKEWFNFLYFMKNYSKEIGFSFYDEQNYF
jgi:photosystem II protein